MKIKDKLKPKTPPITPGVYVGICIGVVDVGEQYSKRYDKYSNNVLFIFELPGQMIKVDGEQKPRQLSREFPYAKKQTSNIRKFLSSWNGVQYNDEQFVDLDVSSQLGRGCTEINFERTPQCKVNPLVKTNFWQKLRWIDKVGSRGKTREKVAKSR